MGITVYLFDSKMKVRDVLARDVSELLHTEEEWLLDAKIPASYGAEPGEYLGFWCVDERFRLFEIDEAEDDSTTGLTAISATDAGAAELNSMIAPETRLEGKGAAEMAAAVLAGSGWELGTVTATERTGYAEWYYKKVWACLEEIKTIYNARVIPYYSFDGEKLTGRKVDVLARTPVFRGRVFQGRSGTEDISLRLSGSPRTIMYGLGKTTGTGSVPERLTIADAEWSKAKGDPADKPKGQDWIADPEAVELYGRKADIYDDGEEADAAALLKKTWEHLQERKKPVVEGTATAQDMEMAPGQDWKKVRLYDQVGVVDKRGIAFLTQVLGIERDYIRPWLTKFDLGDEKQEEYQKKKNSLASQVSTLDTDVKRAGGRAGGAGNKGDENRDFIVENMENIRLHTIAIGKNANEIQETEIRMGNAEVSISAQEKQLSSQGERLNAAEITLNGSESTIGLVAKVQKNGEDISAANVKIDGNAANIELKVSKNGVISSINQTPESITIDASKINLNGYVTASALSAEVAALKNSFSDSISTKTAYVMNTLQYGGWTAEWKSKSVVTNVTANTTSKHGTWERSDGQWTGSLLQSVELKVTKSTIYYMGRDS